MTDNTPSRRRRVLSLISLLTVGALGLGLTGCAAFAGGGQTTEQAIARVEDTPGLSTASVKMTSGLSGFTRTWFMRLSIILDDGYRVGDPDAALEWALKTALSINDTDQKSLVFVGFFDQTGEPVTEDWAASIAHLGFDVEQSSVPLDSGFISFTRIDDHDFGSRPISVPEVPEGAFVRE